MNGEIKVAVCDDLEEDRQVLVNLLSEYTDKNNLYVKIQEFTSGEAFWLRIHRSILWFLWISLWTASREWKLPKP